MLNGVLADDYNWNDLFSLMPDSIYDFIENGASEGLQSVLRMEEINNWELPYSRRSLPAYHH